MKMSMEPWQKAEISGPEKALVFARPEVVVTMIKRAKRPILVVGHEAVNSVLGEEKVIDYAIGIAKTTEAPLVATAHMLNEFLKREYQPAAGMPLVDIANRLKDSEWKGLDGMGQYDLALFLGIPYYMEWLILSALKHFSSNLTTISLGRYYQPHATCSFSNLTLEHWIKSLKVIVSGLEE